MMGLESRPQLCYNWWTSIHILSLHIPSHHFIYRNCLKIPQGAFYMMMCNYPSIWVIFKKKTNFSTGFPQRREYDDDDDDDCQMQLLQVTLPLGRVSSPLEPIIQDLPIIRNDEASAFVFAHYNDALIFLVSTEMLYLLSALSILLQRQ